MSIVERTTAGPQYVLPGAERRTAPGSAYSIDGAGQLHLREMAPSTDRERMQALADAPLRPRKGQRPPPAGGLFRR
jgi:hypothetical protein